MMYFVINRPLHNFKCRGRFYKGKPKVNYVFIRIYEADTLDVYN